MIPSRIIAQLETTASDDIGIQIKLYVNKRIYEDRVMLKDISVLQHFSSSQFDFVYDIAVARLKQAFLKAMKEDTV